MGARKREKGQEKKNKLTQRKAQHDRRRAEVGAARRVAGARTLQMLRGAVIVFLAISLLFRFAHYKLERHEMLQRSTTNETLVSLRKDAFGVAVKSSLHRCHEGASFTRRGLTKARSSCLWPLFTAARDPNATYFRLRRHKCDTWRLAIARSQVGHAYAAHSIHVWTAGNASVEAALMDDQWLDAKGGDRRVRTELITSLEAAPWDEGGWKRKGLIQQRAAKFRKRDDDTAFVASLAKVAPPANAMVRLRGEGFYRARGGVVAVLEQYRLPARALRRVPRFVVEKRNEC